jgi:beta-N-acetylhexosaminidase
MSADLRRLASGTFMAGFAGPVAPSWVARAVDEGLGSICLYGSNVESPQQLSSLTSSLHRLGDVVLATDEEGGDVTRLHYPTGSPQPGAAALGFIDDLDVTRACARAVGAELGGLGIVLNLGPVADVNSNPANPVIGTRSFGASPDRVAAHVTAWVEAQQATGVAACVKHFPGHGATSVDSHVGLPSVGAPAEVLEERELVPFRAAVDARASAVMTAHVLVRALDPDHPATFSPLVVDGLLRQQLGFDGVVVPDALDRGGASGSVGRPEAAVRALEAGCDLLCLGPDLSDDDYDAVVGAVVAAVRAGRVLEDRLGASRERVRRLGANARARAAGAAPARMPKDAAFAEAVSLGPAVTSWLDGPGAWVAVQVDTGSNPAVGEVPWGLRSVVPVVPSEAVRPGERVVVAARDIGHGHPALAVRERLAAAGHDCLLVEHGWPRPGTRVDVVTHGGSPTLSRLLVERLDPSRRRP